MIFKKSIMTQLLLWILHETESKISSKYLTFVLSCPHFFVLFGFPYSLGMHVYVIPDSKLNAHLDDHIYENKSK